MKSFERLERLAWVALALIFVGLPAVTLGYQFVLRPTLADVRTIDILAAAPEVGGFQPEAIRIAAGERVRLRFSAPDVTHGIAIGPGLDLDLGHVDPGEIREVELTFDQPGRYIYYCNTWCSPNHWRMRGTIEVYDPDDPGALIASQAPDPVLASLLAREVDIDAPHQATAVLSKSPSAARGAKLAEELGAGLPPELQDPLWRREHSPVQAWAVLLGVGLSEDEAWDVVAYLWLSGADQAQLEKAETLYAKNCAACHGETGDGVGPGVDALAAQGLTTHDGMGEHNMALADPQVMLGGTSEIYYAKLRRGGMGTGMPSFGSILTPEETWGLVDYVWTLAFAQDQ